MKHALPMQVIKVIPSYHARDHSGARAWVQTSAPIQGGNGKMPGIQSPGHVYDDGKCQVTIAEFLSDHGLLNGTYWQPVTHRYHIQMWPIVGQNPRLADEPHNLERINTLLASRVFGTVKPANLSDETAENDAPNAAREALRSNIENSVGHPEAQVFEEIGQTDTDDLPVCHDGARSLSPPDVIVGNEGLLDNCLPECHCRRDLLTFRPPAKSTVWSH